MTELPPEVIKALPGTAGAAASLLFTKGGALRQTGMFLAGSVMAYFGTPWAATFSGLSEGFAGFMLGLVGMAIVAKSFDAWDNLDATVILRDWLRKIFGVPTKET